MTDMIKSDFQLTKTAESYAESIFEHFKDENDAAFDAESFADEMRERAWEYADNSEHVIYTARAIAICCGCNTDDGKSLLEDCYEKPFDGCETFAEVCTRLAFATLLCAIEEALQTLIDQWEPSDEAESVEDSDVE